MNTVASCTLCRAAARVWNSVITMIEFNPAQFGVTLARLSHASKRIAAAWAKRYPNPLASCIPFDMEKDIVMAPADRLPYPAPLIRLCLRQAKSVDLTLTALEYAAAHAIDPMVALYKVKPAKTLS